jgi:methane monooxygenase PmoA-like
MLARRVLSFLFFAAMLPGPGLRAAGLPVEFQRHGTRIDVLVEGKPFTTYYFGPELPKPFLHPLRSARGTIVTRGYPMVKNIMGEDHDHPHHRALYFAHGDINGIDFWGEGTPSKPSQTARGVLYSSEELPKGRTVFQDLEEMKGGPDSGNLRALFDLVGPDGKAIGTETQEYMFRGDDTSRTIDCAFTLAANHGPLKMGDTKEGTFAIRVVKALDSPPGHMLNSNGGVGEAAIWGKRANWVDYSGMVGGERLGLAIFDNPANIKHPTYWHARGYGLFAVNPFGEHDFYNDPKRDGSVTISAGQSLILRYRVFVHPGDAAEGHVAEAYQHYAETAK